MNAAGSGYPRVSSKVKRRLEAAMTVVWLGGTILLLEVFRTGWWGPLVLLFVVVVIEVVFIVWNDGHLPGAKGTSEQDLTQK